MSGEGLALSVPGATLTLAPRSGIAISRSGLVLTPTLIGGLLRPLGSGDMPDGDVLGLAAWRGRSAGLTLSATLLQLLRWLEHTASAIRFAERRFCISSYRHPRFPMVLSSAPSVRIIRERESR